DYYEASVADRTRVRQAIPRSSWSYVLARRRRPTHLLQYPHWASLHGPEGCTLVIPQWTQGWRRFQTSRSGGGELASSGDWGSGNPAFAISRGSPSTPSRTSGPGHWFPGMLLSPSPFGSR